MQRLYPFPTKIHTFKRTLLSHFIKLTIFLHQCYHFRVLAALKQLVGLLHVEGAAHPTISRHCVKDGIAVHLLILPIATLRKIQVLLTSASNSIGVVSILSYLQHRHFILIP